MSVPEARDGLFSARGVLFSPPLSRQRVSEDFLTAVLALILNSQRQTYGLIRGPRSVTLGSFCRMESAAVLTVRGMAASHVNQRQRVECEKLAVFWPLS